MLPIDLKAHVAELLAEHIDVPIDLTIEGYPFAFAVRASLTQEEQNAVYALIDKQLDGFDLNDTLADQTKDCFSLGKRMPMLMLF